jgi:recombinational DNA repair protein RecR
LVRAAERIALWMVQAREQQPEGIACAIAETRASVDPCVQCGFFASPRDAGATQETVSG